MTTDVFIAVGLAITITALLAWLGDWAGIRRNGRIEQRLAACACPACGVVYGLEAVRAGGSTIVDYDPGSPAGTVEPDPHPPGGELRVITCARCRAVREWRVDGRLRTGVPGNPPPGGPGREI